MKSYIRILAIFLFVTGHTASNAASFTLNAYPYLGDVDTDSDFTITAFVPLPHGFSYFSFMNFGGVLHTGSVRFQITEQNINWRIRDNLPFDLVAQDTIRNGRDNDTVHLGLRWRMNQTGGLKPLFDSFNLSYNFQIFPVRFDQRDRGGWQLSHVYSLRFPYISDRLYFSGFLDHNIDENMPSGGKRDNIVSENQFGLRLYRQLFAVIEFRINEYRRSDTTNFGAGLEIKANW